MIHVAPAVEPPAFDGLVRVPGRNFLAETPHPTTEQFRSRAYWTRALELLHHSYRGICAYSCHWIPYDVGADTVEHFLPKSVHPAQAYEWLNYRFVCQTLNGRKGMYDDVLDPFIVVNGWFLIDFPSLLVRPADNLDPPTTQRIIETINRLRLNDEATCYKSRQRYVKDYCVHGLPFSLVQRDAPFIAGEIERQGYVGTLNDLMGYEPEF